VGIARRCELDFVKLQVRMSSFAEAFGAAWRPSGSEAKGPVMERAGGLDARSWRRIADAEPAWHVLADQVDALAAVVRDLGPATPCLQTVFSPGMVAWLLAGRDADRLLNLLGKESGLMAAGLHRIAETLARFARESIAAGAAGVFYAVNPFADAAVIERRDYERMLLAHDLTALAGAEGGWFNMLHLCGGRIYASLIEALRPHCVNWSTQDGGNPGLPDVRDRYGVAVAGGVHRDRPIRTGTVEAVRAEAAAALGQTGGRGHLLAPGCSVSPWPFDREGNVRALAEAASRS
jgi:uroporphyrinogen decarboxylase